MKTLNALFLLFLSCFPFVVVAFAESPPTLIAFEQWSSLKPLPDFLKKLRPQETLVLFDVDMTLLQPQHPALFYPNLKTYSQIYRDSLEPLSAQRKDELLTRIIAQHEMKPVESFTPKLIQGLQKKGFRTLAFTGSLTGSVGSFPLFEQVRFEQLKKNKIDFQDSFPKWSHFIFSNLSSYRGQFPSFYRGILSSNGEQGFAKKAETLIAFLKHVQQKNRWAPQTIVFLDDRRKNLESVSESLKFQFPSIRFVGIEYQGGFHQPTPAISAQVFQQFWEEHIDQILQEPRCFLAAEETGSPFLQEGSLCQTRQPPCSTFKCFLAIMGYEAGILKDQGQPEWTFSEKDPVLEPPFLEAQKGVQTPTSWMKYSTVWFSQVLTQKMGLSRFQEAVSRVHYGNEDLSGEPGKKNGLTSAWLNSLQVSPVEQLEFLQKWKSKKLPFRVEAQEKASQILPEETNLSLAGRVFGKTGACRTLFNEDVQPIQRKLGWYVGWVEPTTSSQKPFVFVQLSLLDPEDQTPWGSLRAKPRALRQIQKILATASTR